eukprot:10367991-Alexandrium_andersonii.AAC.1
MVAGKSNAPQSRQRRRCGAWPPSSSHRKRHTARHCRTRDRASLRSAAQSCEVGADSRRQHSW